MAFPQDRTPDVPQEDASGNVTERQASQGIKLGVMRYVLGISFGLVIVGLAVVFVVMD